MPESPPIVEFASVSSAQLNQIAVNQCRFTKLPAGSMNPTAVAVAGCPECGDSSQVVVPLEVVRALPHVDAATLRGADAAEFDVLALDNIFRASPQPGTPIRVTVQCRCQHKHGNTPKGESGCGRYWSVLLVGDMAEYDSETPGELDRQGLVTMQRWRQDELADVRKTATAWQAGLSAALALVSTVLVIKGPESVTSLSTAGRNGAAILLGIALLSAATGLMLALMAGNGLPGIHRTGDIGSVPATRDHDEAVAAAKKLRYAILTTAVAFLLICASVGVSWFSVAPSAKYLEIGAADGSALCGEIVASKDSAMLTVKLSDGTLRSYDVSTVQSVAPSSRCD